MKWKFPRLGSQAVVGRTRGDFVEFISSRWRSQAAERIANQSANCLACVVFVFHGLVSLYALPVAAAARSATARIML
jgi:hypothetical protein